MMEDGIFNTPEARQALEDWRKDRDRREGVTSTRAPLRQVHPPADSTPAGCDDVPLTPMDAYSDIGAPARGETGEAKGGGRVDVIAKALRPLGELKAELRNTYLVKGWIDQGAASTIYGESNVGKTFLALDMGLHVAAGEDWHGSRVAQGLVIYAAAEGGRGIVNRLAAFKKDKPELARSAAGNFILLPLTLDLCAPGDAQAFVDALGDLRPALVVIDTLARSMGAGDENTAKDMGQFVANVDYIRAETGAHVLVIHHSGKDTSRGARGSGALRGAVDTEIELTRDGKVISATTRKQRDMPDDAAFHYSLRSVFIGYDEDGDAVTSCVVEPTEEAPKRGPKLNEAQKLALDTYKTAAATNGVWDGGAFLGLHVDDWRPAFYAKHTGDTPDAKKKAFQRARGDLVKLKKMTVQDDVYLPSDSTLIDAVLEWASRIGTSGTGGTKAGHVPARPGTDGTQPYRGVPLVPPGPTEGPTDCMEQMDKPQ